MRLLEPDDYKLPKLSLKGKVSEEEWDARVNLAAAYRIADYHDWTHMIFNHISLRVPGKDDHFLINPLGVRFKEVTASNLVKIDVDGNIQGDTLFRVIRAGFVIHSAVHRSRSDAKAVWHTHTLAGMAVGAQKQGLLPLNMGAIHFYNRIGYHDYEGPSVDEGERERLARALGNYRALVLRNHGLLTVGRNIAEAFVNMWQLEKACASQVSTLAGGAELHLPPHEVCEHSASLNERQEKDRDVWTTIWPTYRRLADELDPSYRE